MAFRHLTVAGKVGHDSAKWVVTLGRNTHHRSELSTEMSYIYTNLVKTPLERSKVSRVKFKRLDGTEVEIITPTKEKLNEYLDE